jgi:phosphatidylglycerophosphate synthase
MAKPQHSVKLQPGDILTPANVVSVAGLALVLFGSFNITKGMGVIALFFGRCFDLLDGPIARRTHTSRFGAAVDALSDKLAMTALLIASVHFHVAPTWIIIYIAVQNIANLILSVRTELRGGHPEAAREGKYAVFLQNIALGTYATAGVIDVDLLRPLALVVTLTSIYWAALATRGYAEQFLNTKPSAK